MYVVVFVSAFVVSGGASSVLWPFQPLSVQFSGYLRSFM